MVQHWRIWKEKWGRKGAESCVLSDWHEDDGAVVSKYWEHARSQEEAVQTQDRVFCVLRFEGEADTDSESAMRDEDLNALLGEDAEHSTMSNFSIHEPVQLRSQTIEEDPIHEPVQSRPQTIEEDPPSAVDTCHSFSSLIQLSPHRHYSEKTGVMANSDRLQDLRRRAQPPKSAFPGPHGEFRQMGTIHQYMNPTLPYPEEQDDELTADFIYLSFKPGVVDWDSDGLISNSWFLEYKREIKRVEECAGLVWCRPVGTGTGTRTSDDCVLIICTFPPPPLPLKKLCISPS